MFPTTSTFSDVKYGVGYHRALVVTLCSSLFIFHADDTQLHVPVKAEDHSYITKLEACLSALENWMSCHFLLLYSENTEMVVTGHWKCDYITPILASLLWLPIHVRSVLEVLLMTYKNVNGFASLRLSALRIQGIGSQALKVWLC